MPQRARRHFDGNAMFRGMGPDITRLTDQPEAQTPGNPTHQALIRITGIPAQEVIEVGHAQPPSIGSRQGMEQMQQHHRVESAGNGDKNRFARADQLPLLDVLIDALNQRVHAFQR